MISVSLRRGVGVLVIAAATAHVSGAADDTRSRTDSSKGIPPSSSARPSSTKSGAGARGQLPDPALLDGSNQPAEKKSEYGMIGDFELPGDENARNGKVGGPQTPGGQQQQQGQQNGGGGGIPQAGGGGGQQSQQGAGQQAQAGGQQGGGPQNQNAAGNPVAGGGDPNAKADGTQVAQLGGEPSGGQQGGGPGEKPPSVAIGDSAMQIKTAANTPGVVGGEQQIQGNTQHHEKGTGSGGKTPTGTQGNNRVEKGRTIPAGL
jgi:hypothetical protein